MLNFLTNTYTKLRFGVGVGIRRGCGGFVNVSVSVCCCIGRRRAAAAAAAV